MMCPEKAYERNFLTYILFSMQLYLIVQNTCKKILFSIPKALKKSTFSNVILKSIQEQSFHIPTVTD